MLLNGKQGATYDRLRRLQRIERMENKVLEKLKSSGLGILADKLIDTEVWHNTIDAMIELEN